MAMFENGGKGYTLAEMISGYGLKKLDEPVKIDNKEIYYNVKQLDDGLYKYVSMWARGAVWVVNIEIVKATEQQAADGQGTRLKTYYSHEETYLKA